MRIDYELLDREPTELGELSLHRYTTETGEQGYELRMDDAFLMASHGAAGETVMAKLAYDRLTEPVAPLSVLVGGLGAGHTLRAALDLPAIGEVLVSEIGAKVVAWNRRYFAESNGHAVDDPRVRVRVGDLARLLREQRQAFDLMLLDVDNGPGWLAAQENAALYGAEGLTRCRQALRDGGVLAMWSPEPNDRLRGTLGDVFGAVDEACVSESLTGAPTLRDVIYLVSRRRPAG